MMVTENISIFDTVIGSVFFVVLILLAIIFISVIIYILFRAGNYRNSKKMAATSSKIMTIMNKQELSRKKHIKKLNPKYTLTFKDMNNKEITLEVSRWEYVMHNIGESGLLSFHGKKFIGFDTSQH